ncbi:MAG: Fic/DOC family N-terminal domain-containing protein [Bacillota bacterium]|nr:Fic/DOC family N-terminal domain-containing protein [Bacillota bacterium]
MLLSKAHRLLGILEGMSQFIEDIDVIESMFIKNEALLSCQIEGNRATVLDILYPAKKKSKHLQETQCCIETIEKGMRIRDEGYSNRLLCDLYKILRADDNNEIGNCYRKIQLFDIPGVFIADRETYNPTAPEDIGAAMDDLERYIKANQGLDELIKMALIIYQFVTISPFETENKKSGRLLIGFLLANSKVLSKNLLCFSDFIILDKIGFYDRLAGVRFAGDYKEWVKHFLKGVIFSSEKAIDTINRFVALKEENRKKMNDLGHSDMNTIKLLEYMEKNPMTNVKTAAEGISLSYNTTAKAINILENLGIIKQGNHLSRNRCYIYQKYIDIIF